MINNAVLMGRLTRNPEARQTPSGMSMCTFSLAVDRGYAKQGEEKQTDFINIIAFGGTADFVLKYFGKGAMIAVCGRIQSRKWTDESGAARYAVEVIAERVSFTGDKLGGAQGGYTGAAGGVDNSGGGFNDFAGAPVGFENAGDDDSGLPF